MHQNQKRYLDKSRSDRHSSWEYRSEFPTCESFASEAYEWRERWVKIYAYSMMLFILGSVLLVAVVVAGKYGGFPTYPFVVVLWCLWILITVGLGVFAIGSFRATGPLREELYDLDLDPDDARTFESKYWHYHPATRLRLVEKEFRIYFWLTVLGSGVIAANLFGLFSLLQIANNFVWVLCGFTILCLYISLMGLWHANSLETKHALAMSRVEFEEIMAEITDLREDIKFIKKDVVEKKE